MLESRLLLPLSFTSLLLPDDAVAEVTTVELFVEEEEEEDVLVVLIVAAVVVVVVVVVVELPVSVDDIPLIVCVFSRVSHARNSVLTSAWLAHTTAR